MKLGDVYKDKANINDERLMFRKVSEAVADIDQSKVKHDYIFPVFWEHQQKLSQSTKTKKQPAPTSADSAAVASSRKR